MIVEEITGESERAVYVHEVEMRKVYKAKDDMLYIFFKKKEIMGETYTFGFIFREKEDDFNCPRPVVFTGLGIPLLKTNKKYKLSFETE